MSLPKAFMDEIRARIPLSDIVGQRVRLQRAGGREFKGCCPFHNEKTPSFTLNDDKGFYHCFGCGAHGDVIRFLMEHDNLPFMDAVEHLAREAGLEVPKQSPQEVQKYKKQKDLYDLLEVICEYFETQLRKPENAKALDYFLSRGLRNSTISLFRLGYAPEDGDALYKYLKLKGFSDEMMLESGVLRASTRGKNNPPYSFFRGRAIFPVQDMQGRVVAFGGRVLAGAPKDAPKYINSPESPVFHKGRMLYGLNHAKKPIGDGGMALVVEGYMDAIALAQAGFTGAVAPLGTALTESQIMELWKVMPPENRYPVLCFDGDNAGQRAAVRAMDRVLPILKPDHSVKFAFLPEGQDPDDLLKSGGAKAMQRVLGEAVSLMDMMWMEDVKGRDFSAPEVRAGLKSALERRVLQMADKSLQEFYLHEVNQRVKDAFLTSSERSSGGQQRGFTPYRGGKGRFQPPPPGPDTAYRPPVLKVRRVQSSQHIREKVLLAAMINYPELFEEFGEALGMIDLGSKPLDYLRQDLIDLLSVENSLDFQAVKQHLSQTGHERILEELFDKSLYIHGSFAKPGLDLETVREGWRDTWERSKVKTQSA